MKNNKILITGASGFLGLNLINEFYKTYSILGIYKNNKIKTDKKVKLIKCDLKNKLKLKKIIEKFKPSVIIHCAAISDIENCEKKKKNTFHVNVEVTKNILKFLNTGQKLIFISSDHLFCGNKKIYKETSKTKPLNYYAYTKVLSENLIKQKSKDYVIIRTNFFGKSSSNKYSFADWIVNSLRSKKKISLFKNVYFSPVHISTLAYCINFIIKNNLRGTYNISSTQGLSKYKFGIKIAKMLRMSSKNIFKINKEKIKFLVRRPDSMRLCNLKIKKKIKKNIFNINYNIKKYVDEVY